MNGATTFAAADSKRSKSGVEFHLHYAAALLAGVALGRDIRVPGVSISIRSQLRRYEALLDQNAYSFYIVLILIVLDGLWQTGHIRRTLSPFTGNTPIQRIRRHIPVPPTLNLHTPHSPAEQRSPEVGIRTTPTTAKLDISVHRFSRKTPSHSGLRTVHGSIRPPPSHRQSSPTLNGGAPPALATTAK